MKKIICLLLALVMLSASFAGCGDKTPAVTTAATDTVTSAVAETTDPAETLDIPLKADYEGYEFHILSKGCQTFNDFGFEEESTLPLDNAQYKRKVKVEEDYNIKIVADVRSNGGVTTGYGDGYQAINKQVTSGDCDYDLCIIGGYDVSTLAYSGKLYDLQSVPSLGLTKSWWDQNATESLTIQGVTFFTTGEITVSDNRAAMCLMFNKKLLADYNLDSPYDMVEDGTWTLEALGKLCKEVSEDLNQDGSYTEADRYGLLVWDDSIVGVVNSAGQRCCTINPDTGEIELTLYNESTLSALEQYTDIAYDTQYAFHWQRVAGAGSTVGKDMWASDKALFYTTLVDLIPQFREMESDFGVLPYPKLNETQDTYYTSIAPFNSNFVCVPLVQNDVERTGVIAEALAYYGKQIVTPALYDITLIGQSVRDEESEPMLEIIFDNLIYDVGYYFQVGPYNKQIIYKLRDRDNNFTSMYDTYKPTAIAFLKQINQSYAKAVAIWQDDAN